MLKHGVCVCAKGADLPCKVGEDALSQESTAVGSREVGLDCWPHLPVLRGCPVPSCAVSAACDLPE